MALLLLLLRSALAQDAPPTEVSEPDSAEASERGAAGEVAVGLTLPAGGLGLGGGIQAHVAVPVGARLELGPALVLRAPSAAEGSLEDPALANPLAWETRLTSVALAARGALQVTFDEQWAGRVALEAGIAGLSQRTTGGAGVTIEHALAPWISPRIGAQRQLGPGALAFDAAVHYAPEALLVTGGMVGGTGATLAVGYRFAL